MKDRLENGVYIVGGSMNPGFVPPSGSMRPPAQAEAAKRQPGRPYAGGSNPTRSMRIGGIYDQAKAKAEAHGETIAAVVERLLSDYLVSDVEVIEVTKPDPRMIVTHLVDQLDAAMAELEHWFATGECVECERCAQSVPAAAIGKPVRHQLRRHWCEVND